MSFDNGIGTIWTPYSATGQIQVTGSGYGIGPYGEGGYDSGGTVVLITIELNTEWTFYPER